MSCCRCSFAEYPSFDDEHSDVDIPAVALTKPAFSFCRRRLDIVLRTWQQHVDSFCLLLQLPDRAAQLVFQKLLIFWNFCLAFPVSTSNAK